MSRFQVNLPQNQIRKMSAEEVEEKLKTAAVEQIDKRDCSPLVKYLEPLFAEKELANWAAEKFGVFVSGVQAPSRAAPERNPPQGRPGANAADRHSLPPRSTASSG